MGAPDHELLRLSRSVAMGSPGSKVPVERELIIELIDEVVAHRRLMKRLGADLRTVARAAQRKE